MPCPVIENVFSQMELPLLDLKLKSGDTGYIDFISPEDMSHSIMRGTDMYGRPFVSLKIQAVQNEQDVHVGTFFQRYSDNFDDWAFGTDFLHFGILYHDSRVRPVDYPMLETRLKQLIAGQSVKACNECLDYRLYP